MFARTYLPLVRTFFMARWRGVQQAEDLEDGIQETFVECFREAGPPSCSSIRVFGCGSR